MKTKEQSKRDAHDLWNRILSLEEQYRYCHDYEEDELKAFITSLKMKYFKLQEEISKMA